MTPIHDATASRVWWVSAVALCGILITPFFVVDVLPLQDYANHLARMFVLAAGEDDPILSRFYVARWGLIPDLGLDLLGVPLMHILPVHVVGRIVAGIALLLPVLGVLAYGRVLHGRSAWPFVCGLVVYNQTFLLGFLAFTLGIGRLCYALPFGCGGVKLTRSAPSPLASPRRSSCSFAI